MPSSVPTTDPVELALALIAVDPLGIGGIVLDHPSHEGARGFCAALLRLLPRGAPQRRIPLGVATDRLVGGIDLAATLGGRRLVAERGLLANADGGFVVVPMAERATTAVRVSLAEALDRHAVRVARDGIDASHDARIAAVLIDESVDDEVVHPMLADRLAFRLPLAHGHAPERLEAFAAAVAERVRAARISCAQGTMEARWVEALCAVAAEYGVEGVRAPLLALRVARAHAALCARLVVGEHDVEVAARLVLAHRATRLPMRAEAPADGDAAAEVPTDRAEVEPPNAREDTSRDERSANDVPADSDERAPLPSAETELLRAAVATALPPGMLAELLARLDAGAVSGRVGAERVGVLRGRPRGAIAGAPVAGARLHLLETLRAAAPWQRIRAKGNVRAEQGARVAIRREDFRVRRFAERTGSTVLFMVDASGSSAMQRLAEAKGAIETLLAESYARRDRVGLAAFRGTTTETLLPPTRALARARRTLAALPGGGGTPLGHAIESAMQQALAVRRGGSAPLVVLLTDGRANVCRDGTVGRAAAERDALAAASMFARFRIPALFVDTSPRGEATARRIASTMEARYALLPGADATALGTLVRTTVSLARSGDPTP